MFQRPPAPVLLYFFIFQYMIVLLVTPEQKKNNGYTYNLPSEVNGWDKRRGSYRLTPNVLVIMVLFPI